MKDLYQPREIVERIIVETRPRPWVGLSIGSCGMLTQATTGKHDGDYMGARSIALTFASRVISAIGLSISHEEILTPQILFDVASEVINDPEHAGLFCTTWKYVPEEVEICSVGTNSVLVFEGDSIEEVIIPHSISEVLRNQGTEVPDPRYSMNPTHALGHRNSCRVDDVRVAHVPLSAKTMIAIIVNRRLAEALMNQHVPREDLPSFIEAWTPLGKRNRTSVLISL